MMVPKVTIKDSKTIELLVVSYRRPPPMQSSIAWPTGTIARTIIADVCIIDLIWLDPQAVKDPNLDKKDLYRTNYEATRMAIARALKGEPTAEELIANRRKIKHVLFDPDVLISRQGGGEGQSRKSQCSLTNAARSSEC